MYEVLHTIIISPSVSCDLTSDLTSITSGMSVQLTAGDKEAPLPSSADVILVLEEKNTQKLTATTLGDLITDVDTALRNVGMSQPGHKLRGSVIAQGSTSLCRVVCFSSARIWEVTVIHGLNHARPRVVIAIGKQLPSASLWTYVHNHPTIMI